MLFHCVCVWLCVCVCLLAGRSYSVFSQRMLNQCLESLVQKIQSGVVINFEKTGPDPPPIEGESTPRREQLVHAAGDETARIRPTAIHPVHLTTRRPLSPLGPKPQVTIQKRYSIRIPVLIREDAPTHTVAKALGSICPCMLQLFRAMAGGNVCFLKSTETLVTAVFSEKASIDNRPGDNPGASKHSSSK